MLARQGSRAKWAVRAPTCVTSTGALSASQPLVLGRAQRSRTYVTASASTQLAEERAALLKQVEDALSSWASTNVPAYEKAIQGASLTVRASKREALNKEWKAQRAKWDKLVREKESAAVELLNKGLADAHSKNTLNPFLVNLLDEQKPKLQTEFGFDDDEYRLAATLTLLDNRVKPGEFDVLMAKMKNMSVDGKTAKTFFDSYSTELEPFWVQSVEGMKYAKQLVVRRRMSQEVSNIEKSIAASVRDAQAGIDGSKARFDKLWSGVKELDVNAKPE